MVPLGEGPGTFRTSSLAGGNKSLGAGQALRFHSLASSLFSLPAVLCEYRSTEHAQSLCSPGDEVRRPTQDHLASVWT